MHLLSSSRSGSEHVAGFVNTVTKLRVLQTSHKKRIFVCLFQLSLTIRINTIQKL